jgi:hypothetical protein
VAGSNKHLSFAFPLREEQYRSEQVWLLDDRPGVSFVRQERFNEPRVRVRGTAKALRQIARDLEAPFPTLVALEAAVVRAHDRVQTLEGSQLYRIFPVIIDLVERSCPDYDLGLMPSVGAASDCFLGELEPGGYRDVIARWDSFVLSRQRGRQSATTLKTSLDAKAHYYDLVLQSERDSETSAQARLAGARIRPRNLSRPSSLAEPSLA